MEQVRHTSHLQRNASPQVHRDFIRCHFLVADQCIDSDTNALDMEIAPALSMNQQFTSKIVTYKPVVLRNACNTQERELTRHGWGLVSFSGRLDATCELLENSNRSSL